RRAGRRADRVRVPARRGVRAGRHRGRRGFRGRTPRAGTAAVTQGGGQAVAARGGGALAVGGSALYGRVAYVERANRLPHPGGEAVVPGPAVLGRQGRRRRAVRAGPR